MGFCDIFDESFIINLIYEGIYFACGLIFEDQYTNAFYKRYTTEKYYYISKSYNYILEDRII
jgi:hypothetical protein